MAATQHQRRVQEVESTEEEREPCKLAQTCESVVHFRGLVVIVIVSRHYSDALHVIVGLGALRRGLLGICIVEDYCSNDGLPRRLGGPIIVT